MSHPVAITERSGVDEGLRWLIYSGADLCNVARLQSAIDSLPDDGILMLDEPPEDLDRDEFRKSGNLLSYSLFDMGWLVAGPRQIARARTRHAGYRIVGTPA